MRKLTTIILIIVFLVGLSVMLYPTFSNWWNQRGMDKVISLYDETVAEMDDSEKKQMLADAHAYNDALAALYAPLTDYEQVPNYETTLDVSGTGVMGYITIPKIQVNLPIYHGTSAEVLNIAVGHFQGSSLPVGGKGTHAVISAHRGLPSARLFSDLDQLVEGDTFTITILDEILTYEVDLISIVLPNELDKLAIDPEQDYVTLMTCTPYGVNTHRLLVRAHRIDTVYPHNLNITADAIQLDTLTVVPFIAAPLVVILIVIWILQGRISRHKRKFTEISETITAPPTGELPEDTPPDAPENPPADDSPPD